MPALPPPAVTQPVESSAAGAGIGLIFILLVVGLVLFLIIAVCLFFFVKWAVGFLKRRADFLFKVKESRLKLASIHAQSKVHNFRSGKNLPVRLAYPNGNGITITLPVARYGGHFLNSDGAVYLRFFNQAYRYIWFLPLCEPQLLIIPSSKTVMGDIFHMTDEGVLLYAYGMDMIGNRDYFLPVIKDEAGKVIDLKYDVFKSMEGITMGQAVTEFLETYPASIKKAVEMNAVLKGYQKLGDQNVEIEPPNKAEEERRRREQ